MSRTSPWAALYFIALMTFGNYVLFNLLVAILVEGFSTDVSYWATQMSLCITLACNNKQTWSWLFALLSQAFKRWFQLYCSVLFYKGILIVAIGCYLRCTHVTDLCNLHIIRAVAVVVLNGSDRHIKPWAEETGEWLLELWGSAGAQSACVNLDVPEYHLTSYQLRFLRSSFFSSNCRPTQFLKVSFSIWVLSWYGLSA